MWGFREAFCLQRKVFLAGSLAAGIAMGARTHHCSGCKHRSTWAQTLGDSNMQQRLTTSGRSTSRKELQ